MPPFDKIKDYGKTVCEQMRWKKAQGFVGEEIENHIMDQRDAYIRNGDSETLATDKAILQMGDPVEVGMQLDSTHRPKPQWSMLGLTMLLICFGLLIRVFALRDLSESYLLSKHVISIILGIAAMLIVYFADFTLIGKYPKVICFSVMGMFLMTLVFSPLLNGKAYYAQYPPLLFPLAFAGLIYWARNKGYLGLVLCGIALIGYMALTLLIPSISRFSMVALSTLVLVSVAIHKEWFGVKRRNGYLLLFIPAASAFIFFCFILFSKSYVLHRLQVAITPGLDPKGAGYIGMVIRALLENSKFIGSGTLPSQFMEGSFPLPGAATEYLLTCLIFKAGWLSFFILITALLGFITLGFVKSVRQKSGLGLFVSMAVMLTFTLQTLGYIMANLGFLFFSENQLPLISYGKISMIINLALVGIMLSVFRCGDVVRDHSIKDHKGYRRIAFHDGVLKISLRNPCKD